MNKLTISYDKQTVGFLSFNSDDETFSFEYSKTWIDEGFELSPILKFNTNIPSKSIKNFLENLLPEGKGQEILSNFHNISKNNIFALIELIGKETTGALTFSLNDEEIKTSFRELPKKELAQRIKDRKNTPIEIWDKKPRLSLAGVQDKLPILIIDDKFGFGEGKLASTHILKFEKEDENILLNKFLSLNLASKAGLEIPKIKLIKIEDEEVLLIQRFDRELKVNKEVKRKHIIDACQALDLSVLHKYERAFGKNLEDYREGVSFKKLFSLIHKCSSPILTKKSLITWICTNLCLGNSDAHGKNISFFISKDKMTLAPFYDILNINIYKGKYDTDFAMGIDDIFSYDELSFYDIIEFCKELNINLKGFVKEFSQVAKNISTSLDDDIFINFVETNKMIFYKNYKKDIKTRIEKLLKILK
ncbi:MAG: phosphatidylinositol kinase [Arcobacter sp.]|nr:MAG: phosphatidylinositol kinase [Arcobacter sp.]